MNRTLKRIFDVIIAGTAMIMLTPVIAIVAVMVYLRMGRPVMFRQMRPGYKGVPFAFLKFRTMADIFDATGRFLSDEVRLTSYGKMLRRLSLDELPQLWNVLKGDMSLVGPRPLLMRYLDRYTPDQARRQEVKPGITGWAQVNGRNDLTWEERFRLDIWYVDHWSLGLDAWIIWKTIGTLFAQEGISQRGHATMPEFMGSDQIDL
ncbi:MAG: sugar transferase [Candidatus Dormibacteria bacterium]